MKNQRRGGFCYYHYTTFIAAVKIPLSWVSVLLPTLFCFHRLCYKQLSKNTQNIRNPIPFWCKIKSPQQNCTKQKRGGFPVVNFTSNTYQMKREILSFSNKISKHLSKPDKKFSADMTYGMLQRKIFISYWFTALRNIPWCLQPIRKSNPKKTW